MTAPRAIKIRPETAELGAQLDQFRQERDELRARLNEQGAYTDEQARRWDFVVGKIGDLSNAIRKMTIEMDKQ